MEKDPFNINSVNKNKDILNERKINQDLSIKKLSGLLKRGKLNKNIVEEEAKNLNIKSFKLSYKILIEAGLIEDFLVYSREIGIEEATDSDEKNILYTFLEKIQQKKEPAKVEQEPQAGDVSVIQVATTTTIEEEQQPAALTPQLPEAQKLIEYEKKESVKIIPDLSVLSQAPEAPVAEPAQPAKTIEVIPQPERKNWWEVKRETEVMAIEDLDGDIRKFEKHVKELGVAKKDASGRWQWTGGNKKLVFLGDILGDRGMDGIEITSIIGDLANQAEKQKGKVDFLCGNHDMEFIRFLCSAGGNGYIKKNADLFTDQHTGIWELARFDPDQNSELRRVDPLIEKQEFVNHQEKLWAKLYERMPEILNNMKTTSEGKNILEVICQIKAVTIYDDTLFCHTDPTVRMITDLTENVDVSGRVSEINEIFQNNLKETLFSNGKLTEEFKKIEEVYFNARNRNYFVEQSSFEDLVENLLVRLIEHLYEIKAIKFSSTAEEYFHKNGFSGRKWYDWRKDLIRNLESFDYVETELKDTIVEWGKESEIAGNYMGEARDILDAFKTKNKGQMDRILKLTDLLVEKIERLNSMQGSIVKVKNSGINAIIHGHSPVRDRYYDKNGLIIVSPHGSFSGSGGRGGTSIVQKSGRIDLPGKSFRKRR